MNKILVTILAAAICSLAISVTAFAAEFINADQVRNIAAQLVLAGGTHLVTKDESYKHIPLYEVKFYDNVTNTAYEVEVLRNSGKVREFSMDAKTVQGSPQIILSVEEIQNIVRAEYPNAVFTNVEIDHDDGLYEYDVDFYTTELRGEMNINPATGAVSEKEIKYSVY